ncbi:receptor-like protein kinase FERONIA [Malania oleifera]|uniref:receptor-like protein kinase FERONIA n=1 Tax=Malania oleifera TaxID=397392 RepID=UPI0025AE8AF6|nr:receptor-like protein kinase FERONIA [Malania oleifera]
MLTYELYLTCFLRLLISVAAPGDHPYTPTDYILLSCGDYSNATSPDGRIWDGDALSKFSPPNIRNSSFQSTAFHQDPSVPQIPYLTARIFHSPASYAVPVSPGPKFLRLHFYPATYSSIEISQFFFSVTVNGYTLLSNFSAYLSVAASNPHVSFIIKEYCINTRDYQELYITFSPSPSSHAFVNGIEIVSVPTNLYSRGEDYPPTFVTQMYSNFFVDNFTVLETLYRLNVGGNLVPGGEDTGMFRTWQPDDPYIQAPGLTPHRDVQIRYTTETPVYTAPVIVYRTSRTMGELGPLNLNYNLTWIFSVDSGFNYLFRLHFCEFQLEITLPNQRVFSIFIGNQTAENGADVIVWSKGTGIPIYRDYIFYVVGNGNRGKTDLWLALHPNTETRPKPQFSNAILNGLEIFKLNGSDGSLATPNPEPPMAASPSESPVSKNKVSPPWAAVAGAALGSVIVIVLIVLLCFFRRRRTKDHHTSLVKSSWVPFSYTSKSIATPTTTTTANSIATTKSPALPSDLCRRFLLAEIKSATRDFHGAFVIGVGGFGRVYKGHIDGGTTTVAIKRSDPLSKQGAREFQTEIQMLSQLRHVHLVPLIGYCDDGDEMILVYEYMARGTLRDHLYKTKNPLLPWKKRLEICGGAARGLQYLHAGAKHPIIHRDVKSSNILLDDRWVAKVSDFGLSKTGPTGISQNHVSTAVRGSIGYVDPEYYRRRQLTDKSDVYSFGVVLWEVLCGRPALMPDLPKEQRSLAEWARLCYRSGTLYHMVDPNLRADIAPECLKKFADIAEGCVHDHGIERPTMCDVVWGLEFALQLQHTSEKNMKGGNEMRRNTDGAPGSPVHPGGGREGTTDDEENDDVFTGSVAQVSDTTVSSEGRSTSGSSYNPDRMKSEAVFSEIKDPKAR